MVVGAAVVVVVPGFGGGQSSRVGGSGWPTSSAMIRERPWASLNSTPIAGITPAGKAFSETEMGFCPVWRRSPPPGVVSYLQTNHLGLGGGLSSCPLADGVPQAARGSRSRRRNRHIAETIIGGERCTVGDTAPSRPWGPCRAVAARTVWWEGLGGFRPAHPSCTLSESGEFLSLLDADRPADHRAVEDDHQQSR